MRTICLPHKRSLDYRHESQSQNPTPKPCPHFKVLFLPCTFDHYTVYSAIIHPFQPSSTSSNSTYESTRVSRNVVFIMISFTTRHSLLGPSSTAGITRVTGGAIASIAHNNNNKIVVRSLHSRFYRTGTSVTNNAWPVVSNLTIPYRRSTTPWNSVATTTISSSSNSRVSYFSTTPTPEDPQAQFKAKPPVELNLEMAVGIQNANHLILSYGVGAQRLQLLSHDVDMPLVLKWQRMMEIYLGAQLHVIAALGYDTNEHGIMMYTQQLGQFITSKCDPAQQDTFRSVGRKTWRHMLVTAFDLDTDMIQEKYGNEMTIVDARNTVHKVASRLIEPRILAMVATKVAQIPPRKFKCMPVLFSLQHFLGGAWDDPINDTAG
jgi:hypothetical protein